MKVKAKNVRIVIENRAGEGFNIYLDFSGQREYLMSHRHSGILYQILKDGMDLETARRWRVSKEKSFDGSKTTMKAENAMKHLLCVVDEYLWERQIA